MNPPSPEELQQSNNANTGSRPASAALPDPTGGEVPVVRWSNRRKMAWYSFWALLVYTPFYWMILPLWFQYWQLPTAWLQVIGESFFWFASTMAAVIVSYMGFTALPFMGRGQMGGGGQQGKVQMYNEDY